VDIAEYKVSAALVDIAVLADLAAIVVNVDLAV
jgi:hypothetical protein